MEKVMKIESNAHCGYWLFAIATLFALTLPGAVQALTSDDFNALQLDGSTWTVIDPRGDGQVVVDGTRAQLSIGSSIDHDVYGGGNASLRIMQPVADDDFEVEVKFESDVTQEYQLQGLLVEQAATTYVRSDFYSDGTSVLLFSARFQNGVLQGQNSTLIGAVGAVTQPMSVRLNRTGDVWTQSYSLDGTNWIVADTYIFAIVVQSAGVFAGNSGPTPPAHTAIVDYFFDTANPVVPEDGAPTFNVTLAPGANGSIATNPAGNSYLLGTSVEFSAVADAQFEFTGWGGELAGLANPQSLVINSDVTVTASFAADVTEPVISGVQVDPAAASAIVSWTTDELTTGTVAYGLTATYELGTLDSSTLTNGHSLTIPGLTANQTYQYRITATDQVSLNSASSGSFSTPSSNSSLISDDFFAIPLNTTLWTEVDPLGDGQISLGGGQLTLDVPAGIHDIYTGGNDAVRIVQAAQDEDFEVEAKFVTIPQEAYQIQGIVVQEDADSFLRADFYSDGSSLFLFSASILDGVATQHINTVITGATNTLYLRVNRSGTNWVVSYSLDGLNFIASPTFVSPIVPLEVGPFAANTNAAFTSLVDYFFETSAPIVPEDGGLIEYMVTSAAVNGQVGVSPSAAAYAPGTSLQITAIPDPGYEFVGWSGDLQGVLNPESTVINSDLNVTATFVADAVAPIISNVAVVPTSSRATISWETNELTTAVVNFGETVGYELPSVASSVLSTTHSVVLNGLNSDVLHHFEIVASDAAANSTSTNDDTFTTLVGGPAITSDDFYAAVLNPLLWTQTDPIGDSSISLDGQRLVLSIPSGAHDFWVAANDSARIMQPTDDDDFEVEVKFESIPTLRYQIQGIVVEQSPGNFLRFDFHSDGSSLRFFAAALEGGAATSYVNGVIASGATELYMRVSRVGDQWTQSYSIDGSNWTVANTFIKPFLADAVGVFAASSGVAPAPAFTSLVDYFFNTASPIDPEDTGSEIYTVTTVPSSDGSIVVTPGGGAHLVGSAITFNAIANVGYQFVGWGDDLSGAQNPLTVPIGANILASATFILDTVPPQISNVSVTPSLTTAVISWETDEPTTGAVSYGTTDSYLLGSETSLTPSTSHTVAILGLSGDTTYHFQIEATDAAVLSSVTSDATFQTQGVGSGIVSDDFFASTLNTGLWTASDPGQTSLDGTRLVIDVPGGSNHDVWTTGIDGLQVLQPAADEDFEVEAKFESVPTQLYQIQGVLVKQDSANALRFDFYSANGNTNVFAAQLSNGTATRHANENLGELSGPLYIRVRRIGNNWTMNYSLDGSAWIQAASFISSLVPTEVGPFAGNAGGSNAPQFTALVDYFFDTSDPLNPEDGINNYILSTNVAGGSGSIIRSPEQGQYEDGSVVELVAVPNSGWFFSGWSGDIVNTDNPTTVSITDNTAVQATFSNTPSQTYDVVTNVVGPGLITLNPAGGSYLDGTVVTVTAVPDPSFAFKNWSGDVAETAVSFDLVVNRDFNFSATFALDTEAPTIGEVSATDNSSASSAQVTWLTNETGSSRVEYGLTDSFELGFIEDLTPKTSHSITLSGLLAGETYNYRVVSTDSAGFTARSITHTLQVAEGPIIDVWYGNTQSFAALGQPQQWINIVGNLADPDAFNSFNYSLNGASARSLNIGPFRRLSDAGDFNIDIDYSELQLGQNTILISAVDGLGNPTQTTVTVNYSAGTQWPLPYNVDWSQVDDVSEVAQVTDGIWEVRDSKLHNVRQRYDRNVVLGDVSWTDYEVTVPITINSFDNEGFLGVNARPALGVMLKWPGHTNWTGTQQPAYGYYPGGGGGWYEFDPDGGGDLYIRDFQGLFASQPRRDLELGVTYIWKVRVETQGDGSSSYFVKVWKESETEPGNWDLAENDDSDVPGGSLLLLGHFVDLEIGDVSIRPLANDPPGAFIVASPTIGPAPLVVSFDGRASFDIDGTIVSYDWDFGDGSSDNSGPLVNHAFGTPGLYTAQLTVTDDSGATDSADVLVTVTDGNVNAVSVVTPTPGTLTVEFDATGSSVATGSITSYLWDFGDGNTSTSAVASNTYAVAGSYTYTLTVTDSSSETDQVVAPINVSAAVSNRVQTGLLALYEIEEGAGTVLSDTSNNGTPLDLSINDPSNVSWISGGVSVDSATVIRSAGAASKITNAVTASGEVTVEAWLRTSDLTQNGPARIVSLSGDPSNRNITIGQGVYNNGGDRIEMRTRTTATSNNGTPVLASDQGTLTTALHHVLYSMDAVGFGKLWIDGILVKSGAIGGTLSNWNGSYPLALANEVTGNRPWLGELYLAAFYDRALDDAEVTQNFAAGASGTGVGGNNIQPTATATSDVTSGAVTLTVSFDGSTSVDTDGTIVSWFWDFGDGTTDTSGPSVSHAYDTIGEYTAQLTVTDDMGAADTADLIITVTASNVSAAAAVTPTPGTLSIEFDATGSSVTTGTIASYLWEFGDGNSSTDAVSTHTYASSGPYTYVLTVTDDLGATGEVTATIDVTDGMSTRIQDGLVALYEIEEGTGTVLSDSSNNGAPLDLSIIDPANVSWISGGVSVDSATVIRSAGAASKITNAVTASGEVTVEAWLRTSDLSQNGPARIVSLSGDPSNRNITIGQGVYNNGGDRIEMRTRTTATSNNGTPAIASAQGTLSTALHHVLYSVDAAGFGKLWIDGVMVQSGTIGGTLTNWNGSYPLAFANEPSGNRPWLGELYLAAFYDRALSDADVMQNYASGANGTSGSALNVAPTSLPTSDVASGPVTLTVAFDGTGSSDSDGTIADWLWDFGDGTTDNTGPSVTHAYSTVGQYTAQLTVTDDMGATGTADLIITVNPGNVSAVAIVTPTPDTLMVEFDATASSVTTGTIASYLWDFGDGNTSTDAVTTHTYAASDSYTYTLTVTDNLGDIGAVTTSIEVSNGVSTRVQTGLLAMYEMEEGSGTVVADTSGNGAPLNLSIVSGNTQWSNGALAAIGSSVVQSSGPATKIIDALKTSNAMTVEAWVTSANLNQTGPARVVSISADPFSRNFTLGQGSGSQGDRIEARLRTSTTSGNGQPSTITPSGTFGLNLTHLMVTRDTQGTVQVYVDGQVESTLSGSGALSTWSDQHPLTLFNEATGDRPWLGALHLVAIYDRALTITDVSQNLAAGPNGDGVGFNLPPTAVFDADPTSGDVSLLVNFDATASSDLDGTITNYEWDFGDGNTESGTSVTSHVYSAIGTYDAELTVTDDDGTQSSTTLQIAVLDPNNQPELVVFDWDEPVAIGDRGFPWNTPPMASANGDWTTPINYAEGRLYIRTIIRSQPVSQSMRLQFCIWQDNLTLETCTNTRSVQGDAGVVVTSSQPISSMWKLNGVPLNWDSPRQRYAVAIKNSASDPVSDFNGWNWFGEDPNAWYPLDMRYTVVVVPEGGTFSGWENYP